MIDLPQLPRLLKAVLEARPGQAEARFTQGEVLTGKVIKALGKNSAIVNLRGLNMAATTSRPLTTGQSILVKVEQLAPNFTVSLLTNETPAQEKTAGLLRMYLPQAAPLGEVVAEAGRLLKMLPPRALKGASLHKVMDDLAGAMQKEPGKEGEKANILKLLGLSHEREAAEGKKPRNLKMSLMLLRGNLEQMEAENPGKFREALSRVNRAVQNLELRQLMNADDKGKITSWEIPFWNEGKEDTAKLFVQKRKEGKAGEQKKEAETVAIMLNLKHLGDVRADARRQGQTLEGEIYVEKEEHKALLEKYLPHLDAALKALGFKPRFNALTAKKVFLTTEPETDSKLPVKGLLNVKA